jgi:nucleotide-binding universal stress UspA family protein
VLTTHRKEGHDMNQQRPRVVVGVDGSPGARAALEYALRDAARRDASVEVVSAYAPPEYWAPLYGVPVVDLKEVREGIRKDADETVRAVTAELEGALPQMPPVTITTSAGSAAEALLKAAQGAELLVVGSRGHGGFSSMLLGSVSLQCVLHATCPVTVVRPTAKAEAEAPALAEPAPALS